MSFSNVAMSDHRALYEEESQGGRLARKSKEAPFFPIGIAGCVAACAYGAYKFNKRGQMSPSVFLMQLRVAAQGTVVGVLTLGLLYTMAKKHIPMFKDDEKGN